MENLLEKTILRSSELPDPAADSIASDLPAEKTNAIAKIEQEFASGGNVWRWSAGWTTLCSYFPHQSVGVSPLTNVPLRGAELALPAPRKESQTAGKSIPAKAMAAPEGMIDFANADLNQVIDIYGMMVNRTVLRPAFSAPPAIRLRTTGRLSMEEGIYALETVLALNGILVVKDGEKFVQMLPLREAGSVKAAAPKAEPSAKLFDPVDVPSVGISVKTTPSPTPVADKIEDLRKQFLAFMHYPKPAERPAGRLLELYAGLTDKTAVKSRLDGVYVIFRGLNALTREELIYAIERTFALNDLAIVAVDEKTIQLGGLKPNRPRRTNTPQNAPPPIKTL